VGLVAEPQFLILMPGAFKRIDIKFTGIHGIHSDLKSELAWIEPFKVLYPDEHHVDASSSIPLPWYGFILFMSFIRYFEIFICLKPRIA